MRYLIKPDDQQRLPLCVRVDGMPLMHLWVRGTGTLYCQRCLLVVDFVHGAPVLIREAAGGE